MKKLILPALLLVFAIACKKETGTYHYLEGFQGKYPVRPSCQEIEQTPTGPDTTNYSENILLIVSRTTDQDSMLNIEFIEDSISFKELTVKVAIDGKFQSDSISGRPREYAGQFLLPSSLKFTTFEGNSLGNTNCTYAAQKQSNLD